MREQARDRGCLEHILAAIGYVETFTEVKAFSGETSLKTTRVSAAAAFVSSLASFPFLGLFPQAATTTSYMTVRKKE